MRSLPCQADQAATNSVQAPASSYTSSALPQSVRLAGSPEAAAAKHARRFAIPFRVC